MDDLIRRTDAIAYIDRIVNSGLGKNKSLDYIRKYISALPSAEAVSRETYHNLVTASNDIDRALREYQKKEENGEFISVVRCKDCRHRDLFSCPLTDNNFQKDEDFCSWGERREP